MEAQSSGGRIKMSENMDFVNKEYIFCFLSVWTLFSFSIFNLYIFPFLFFFPFRLHSCCPSVRMHVSCICTISVYFIFYIFRNYPPLYLKNNLVVFIQILTIKLLYLQFLYYLS